METVETIISGVKYEKRIGADTQPTTIRLPNILTEKLEIIRKDVREKAEISLINYPNLKLPSTLKSRNGFMRMILEQWVKAHEKQNGEVDVTQNNQ